MSETEYPNAKIKFVAWLFGPAVDWLHAHGIFGGFIAVPLCGILIYLKYFWRRPKGKPLNRVAKAYVALWIAMLIGCVFGQIAMILHGKGPWGK